MRQSISRRDFVKIMAQLAATAGLAIVAGESGSAAASPRNQNQQVLNVVSPASAVYPLELRNPIDRPYGYILLGSGVLADSDIQIDVTFTHQWNDRTPENSGTGIRFTNGFLRGEPEQNSITLSHARRSGLIFLNHQHGDKTDNTPLGPAPDGLEPVGLGIAADGMSVTVTTTNGTRMVPLRTSLYSSGSSMLIVAGLGPYAASRISQLSISGGSDGTGGLPLVGGDSLRSLADARGVSFGTLANPFRVSSDPRYEVLLRTQFKHVLVPLRMSELRPDRETFNFSEYDVTVNFAGQNGLGVVGQHLVWTGAGTPGWMSEWIRAGSFSRDEMLTIMREQIVAVLERYRGKISRWVVVNEALTPTGYRPDDLWGQRIGPEYIEEAFRTARQTAPEVELIYNESYPIPSPKADRVYELARSLKAKGLIDGVGIQMHVKINDAVGPPWQAVVPEPDTLLAEMRRLGDLGLFVEITEMDVNVFGAPFPYEEKLRRQAQAYAEVVRVALKSGVCRRITTFGFVDPFSWLLTLPELKGTSEAPLLFDENYKPKPAYFAIRDALT